MNRYKERSRPTKTGDAGNIYQEELAIKTAELAKVQEEIEKARENATQSWLDSKPVIDQLETLQVELKNARDRVSMPSVAIHELEAQLEATNTSIESKKKQEHEAKKIVAELSRSLELSPKMETLKSETDNERRKRAKLKQELRLRKQTLLTLQLTLRAVRLESEALGASATEALEHIKQLTTENYDNVQLTHEEYHALVTRANEETALADWRIFISMEQRHAAEEGRYKALKRLKELRTTNISKKRDMEMENKTGHRQKELNIEGGPVHPSTRNQTPGTQLRTSAEVNMAASTNHRLPQRLRRAKHKHIKKKQSIINKVKRFILRNITKFFG